MDIKIKKKKVIIANEKYFFLSIVFYFLFIGSYIYIKDYNLGDIFAFILISPPYIFVLGINYSIMIGGSLFFCEIFCHRNLFSRLNFYAGLFSSLTFLLLYLPEKQHFPAWIPIIVFLTVNTLLFLSFAKMVFLYTFIKKIPTLICVAIIQFLFNQTNTGNIEKATGMRTSSIWFHLFVFIIVVISFLANLFSVNRLKEKKKEIFGEEQLH